MNENNSQTYTLVLANLLRQWRRSMRLSVYAIAKAINAKQNTIARFEQGRGGISLETGLRYLEFADNHPSRPAIMKEFLALIRQKRRQNELTSYERELTKRQAHEDTINSMERHLVEGRVAARLNKEHDEEKQKLIDSRNALETELRTRNDEVAQLKQQLSDAAEQHRKELEQARRDAAQEALAKRDSEGFFRKMKRAIGNE